MGYFVILTTLMNLEDPPVVWREHATTDLCVLCGEKDGYWITTGHRKIAAE